MPKVGVSHAGVHTVEMTLVGCVGLDTVQLIGELDMVEVEDLKSDNVVD